MQENASLKERTLLALKTELIRLEKKKKKKQQQQQQTSKIISKCKQGLTCQHCISKNKDLS